jgi:predicted YcjX-like family ATPase
MVVRTKLSAMADSGPTDRSRHAVAGMARAGQPAAVSESISTLSQLFCNRAVSCEQTFVSLSSGK